MDNKSIIELALIVFMTIGLIGIFQNRIKTGKGIGKRIIQFTGLLIIIPSIILLTLEGIIKAEILGTLFGAIIGYVLSDLAKETNSDN